MTAPLPPHPVIYEINAWVWLDELSRRTGRHLDLASVPDNAWDAVAEVGPDLAWLMGVWERSPAGTAIARDAPRLLDEYRKVLPDLRMDDIVGSPYAVHRYEVAERLGGRTGLAVARTALAARGIRLMLDYVPNHVAVDHPWLQTEPERFVLGSEADLRHDPTNWYRSGEHVVAHGRDPYFDGWTDTAQLNAFAPSLRSATVDTLLDVAAQCDGVRCDMAMLLRNDVFARTWGDRVGPPPDDDFWLSVIPAVRTQWPDFVFMAEVYWGMEPDLLAQGFDLAYDKELYDHLVAGDADAVRRRLGSGEGAGGGLVRFVENHDEPRAAAAFGDERVRAATLTAATQPGARLLHDGQLDGRTVHVPVQLGRRPDERPDADLLAFSRGVIDVLADPALRTGEWRLCDVTGWPDDESSRNLVAWCWRAETSRWLMVVNHSDTPAAGRVATHWDDMSGRSVQLTDPIAGVTYQRAGSDLRDGLYVALDAWGWHCFRVDLAH